MRVFNYSKFVTDISRWGNLKRFLNGWNKQKNHNSNSSGKRTKRAQIWHCKPKERTRVYWIGNNFGLELIREATRESLVPCVLVWKSILSWWPVNNDFFLKQCDKHIPYSLTLEHRTVTLQSDSAVSLEWRTICVVIDDEDDNCESTGSLRFSLLESTKQKMLFVLKD